MHTHVGINEHVDLSVMKSLPQEHSNALNSALPSRFAT